MSNNKEFTLARIKGLLRYEATLSKEEAKEYRANKFIVDIRQILIEECV